MISQKEMDEIIEKKESLPEKILSVRNRCEALGVELITYCIERSLKEQAIIYRSTRGISEIKRKAMDLDARGFDFLAKVLIDVGPQNGRLGKHITWAGPGESYHNYGLAFDSAVMVGGKIDWSMRRPDLWKIYGEVAVAEGLEWAGNWPGSKVEYPHCQLAQWKGSPLKLLSPEQTKKLIDDMEV
ncbi:MAG: M15 family metallopeptidase [Desulfobacterales bacterium]|nr:M15 family metallopeptidase [Desulfobacterales bacterium]